MGRQKLGSMTYQVSRIDIDVTKQNKRGKGVISSQSLKQYRKHAINYGEWCKKEYGIKAFADCKPYIQQYADWLSSKGRSSSTVHTYIAAVCRFFDVRLDTIKKPKRICAKNKRSRGKKESGARRSATREASPRLYDFALKVGIRRAEYGHLLVDDFVLDESGYPCVRVFKGKGGKYQLQRIFPEDVDFVRSYFERDSKFVFSRDEMRNEIDLHALRAVQARRAYDHYCKRIEQEGREKLTKEIQARWEKYSGKPWNESLVREKPYYIRGENKKLAADHGLPLVYDRLALMAVSVFHLSHWRLDVTVSNYMLAVGWDTGQKQAAHSAC